MSPTTVFLDNLHCASCVRTVHRALEALQPAPLSVDVSLVCKSVTLSLPPLLHPSRIRAALDDAGFDVHDVPSQPSPRPYTRAKHVQQCSLCQKSFPDSDSFSPRPAPTSTPHLVSLSVGGMTCSSCVTTVTEMLSHLPGVSDVVVSLLSSSATLRVDDRSIISSVSDTINDCGFDVALVSAEPIHKTSQQTPARLRAVSLRVGGMYCRHCPAKIMDALRDLFPRLTVTKPCTLADPLIELSYEPDPPDFTIRTIISRIHSADPAFAASPYYPPTIEQRTRSIQLREQATFLNRLLFTLLVAIPTFIIGVVYMSFVPSHDASKRYLVEPMWAGNVSRIQWSMFFLATPVMFYSAALFHRRTIKEIIATWRRGSSTPIITRLTKFGSMNLLVSSGVSVAYVASVVLLVLAASRPPASDGFGDTATYFDSVVFVTLFLLCGKYLEAYSKARTADAITALSSLRPAMALLLAPRDASDGVQFSSGTDLEKGDASENDNSAISLGFKVEEVSATLLEAGDIVRVLVGATPPSDGTIVSHIETSFDESSLTGEARLVKKKAGDRVFLGTINKGMAIDVRVDAVGGGTMLDHIVRTVREGQVRRAPIERVADTITGLFVPIVTLLAIITWVVWLALGLGGGVPRNYLDIEVGGWTVWSLEFAIAVFVVACPCGIGLAAPTALLVGSGLAAKYGILARGGGEAFQEMAQVDAIVFDKTGTLTEGGQPQVSDFEITSGSSWACQTVLGIAAELESASSHPLGTAIKQYATTRGATQLNATAFGELAGLGVKAHFDALGCTALIGNEVWMEDHGVVLDSQIVAKLAKWTAEAKSIALLAISDDGARMFSVVALFAISDSLRPEAPNVIRHLHEKGIGTWMISGDNELTAKAVAKQIGIPEMNVLAGVLPHQKAEKVVWLQANGVKRPGSRWQKLLGKRRTNGRCIVAMVGDGINDAPALAASDIGIAIGSGSDVAISSASFILLSSNLKSLLTLCDLSRRVFNRVKQNFVWAFMYNIIAVPVAAGVIYPIGHARLAPVWASLAMAFSSVSVVTSSLLLKLYREPKV